MHLLNEERLEFTLGPAIKSGAEGVVHSVAGEPNFVAKIYHQAPDNARLSKLRALLAKASPKLTEVAAWPVSLLHDGRHYRGFLMSRVQGEEIHQLFNPGERARKFADRRWDFLLHVARNCAEAFQALHDAGVVMGDVNEANLLVLANGCVRLIDCDSYQVANGGQVFTCDVGVDQWTPPELQNVPTLRGVVRAANHDLFGLAVLIFKLVFMGRHPFAGVPLHPGDFELEQAIAGFRFAFSPRAHTFAMRPPPHSLLLDKFPDSVTRMFEAAFLRGSEQPNARPTAARWRDALEVIKRHLTECQRRPWHLYTTNLHADCPWCAIHANGGPDYFECAGVAGEMPPPPATGGLWERIETVKGLALVVPAFEALTIPQCAAQPFSQEVMGTRGTYVGGWFTIAASVAAAPFTGGVSLLGALAGAGMLSGGKQTPEFQKEVERRRSAAAAAEFQVRAALELLGKLRSDYMNAFGRKKTALRASFDTLRALPQERQREFETLKSHVLERCQEAYLAQFFISRASIAGVGEGRKATLISHGIETARDIHRRISVPGFGPVLVSNLMAWRGQIVGRFQPPANPQIPQSDIAQLDARFLARHRTLELELRSAPEELANLNRETSLRISSAQQQLAAALAALGQARANTSVIPS